MVSRGVDCSATAGASRVEEKGGGGGEIVKRGLGGGEGRGNIYKMSCFDQGFYCFSTRNVPCSIVAADRAACGEASPVGAAVDEGLLLAGAV